METKRGARKVRRANRIRTAAKGLSLLAGALVTTALLRPAWTPSISTERAVATLVQEPLNGRKQWILTRGKDRERPLLLFLHGGPGMSAMYLAHVATRRLEEDFVVVHWDRRDAGKSFDPAMPPTEEKVSVQLADAEALVARLRARFGQRRVVLLGHSWGTYLGLLLAARHPDWFAAYVGVGQVTSKAQQRAAADQFLHDEATRRGNREALVALRQSPNEAREKWLFEFGAELHGATSFLPLVTTGLLAPEYTFFDALRVARGSQFAARHMHYDVADPDIATAVDHVDVPVFFIAGRHDYNTPAQLAEDYLKRLRAPKKRLFLFEGSAHFPFLEEPQRFANTMRAIRNSQAVAERLRYGRR